MLLNIYSGIQLLASFVVFTVSLSAPRVPRKVAISVPATDNLQRRPFVENVAESVPKTDLTTTFKQGPPNDKQSPFHFPISKLTPRAVRQLFKNWGWQVVRFEPIAQKTSDKALDPVFEANKWNLNDFSAVTIEHRLDWNINGDPDGDKTEKPTFAILEGLYNRKTGVIILINAKSPEHAAPGRSNYPKLQKISDLTWLVWISLNKESPLSSRNLNYIMIHDVTEESNTPQYIRRILGFLPETKWEDVIASLGPWPGRTFKADESNPDKDIMNSAHGQDVKWFLLQHQDRNSELGLKTVKTFNLFKTIETKKGYEEPEMNIGFEIVDISSSNGGTVVEEKGEGIVQAISRLSSHLV